MADLKPEQVTAAPVPTADSSIPQFHILAVDDDAPCLELVGRILNRAGFTVETASNGQEAVSKVSSGSFDLVITDRAMPGMDGDQVACETKGTSPQTRVLMLTGFGCLMPEGGVPPACVDAVISKPITKDELLQSVMSVMQRQS